MTGWLAYRCEFAFEWRQIVVTRVSDNSFFFVLSFSHSVVHFRGGDFIVTFYTWSSKRRIILFPKTYGASMNYSEIVLVTTNLQLLSFVTPMGDFSDLAATKRSRYTAAATKRKTSEYSRLSARSVFLWQTGDRIVHASTVRWCIFWINNKSQFHTYRSAQAHRTDNAHATTMRQTLDCASRYISWHTIFLRSYMHLW